MTEVRSFVNGTEVILNLLPSKLTMTDKLGKFATGFMTTALDLKVSFLYYYFRCAKSWVNMYDKSGNFLWLFW